MRYKHPLDQVNYKVLPAYNCGWGVYSAHALWYHYSRTCLHRMPAASTRRVFFGGVFPISFLRWVSSVICMGRARGARPSSAPSPSTRPFGGKGEGHAARTYAKNIPIAGGLLDTPHTGLKTSGGSGARLRAGTVSS